MFEQFPEKEKAQVVPLLTRTCSQLGVPVAAARKALYWHIHKYKATISNLAQLEATLNELPAILNRYNQDVTRKQLLQGTQAANSEY